MLSTSQTPSIRSASQSEFESVTSQDAEQPQSLLHSIAENMERIGSGPEHLENTVAGSPQTIPMFNVNPQEDFNFDHTIVTKTLPIDSHVKLDLKG